MQADVRLWPVMLGWSIVSLLLLFGWKRQAAIAGAGMLVVTYVVLRARFGF